MKLTLAAVVTKPDQWVELKSPYVGYKAQTLQPLAPTTRSNSRFSRMRSRPQTGVNVQGIEETEENGDLLDNPPADQFASESINELNKTKLDIHNAGLEAGSELNESVRGKTKTDSQTLDGNEHVSAFIKLYEKYSVILH